MTDDVAIDRILEPEAYDPLNGTDADRILLKPLMNAGQSIREDIVSWNVVFIELYRGIESLGWRGRTPDTTVTEWMLDGER